MERVARRDASATLRYQRDGERYLVFAGDEHIGFVRKFDGTGSGLIPRLRWHWTDAYMRRSGHRRTREDAALACFKAYREAES